MGGTWEMEDTPFAGIGVGQKVAALKLASGALLLVSQDKGTFAALSFDDGKTWPHIKKLESVTGYMSAAQAPNGVVTVFGTRMSCVAFNEAWLKQ